MSIEGSLREVDVVGGGDYSEEGVGTGTFTGVLRTYPSGDFEVFSEDRSSPFSLFEEGITSREEALATLERQIRQYRDELRERVEALDEILAGPSGMKPLLMRVSEEGGLRED